ncbi:MAG: Rrf2 family transcriptional regulator [Candidatus Margulisiibacteriota bacterium]
MKLTKSADFAIRIVTYLATEEKSVTMPFLAETLGIPYNNLSKLVQVLAKSSIIQTRQGKNGGIQLLQDAATLSLKKIIDAIDGPTRLANCIPNEKACTLSGSCLFKEALQDIQVQIDALFDNVKIAQIVRR